MVVPVGLLRQLATHASTATESPGAAAPLARPADTRVVEELAMNAVLEAERRLGFVPRDVSRQKPGYDIESAIPGTGRLRFIEVKGRVKGADTVTISRNEILTGLNKPDDFILAIVLIDGGSTDVRYVRTPFDKEPDFIATSVNYHLDKLLAKSAVPA